MTMYFNHKVLSVQDACLSLLQNEVATIWANDGDARHVADRVLTMLCEAYTDKWGGRLGNMPLVKAIEGLCAVCDGEIWYDWDYHMDGDDPVHDACCQTCNTDSRHK
jgi:hypothetical protein